MTKTLLENYDRFSDICVIGRALLYSSNAAFDSPTQTLQTDKSPQKP